MKNEKNKDRVVIIVSFSNVSYRVSKSKKRYKQRN